jgi:predicted PurR-regulated permease PerM
VSGILTSVPGVKPKTWVSALILVAALYWGREILVPIALSVLLTFLLSPLVSRLRAWGCGQVIAVGIVSVAALAAAGLLSALLTIQLYDLAKSLPQYRENIQGKVESISARGGMLTQLKKMLEVRRAKVTQSAEAGEEKEKPVPVEIHSPERTSLETLGFVSTSLFGPLTTTGIVIVFVIFMLLQKDDLRDRFVLLLGEGRLHVTTQALDEAGAKVSRYLLMQLVVNATYGIPVGIGLYLIGVPNAFVWGLLATLLRFIPYVGPVVACIMPIGLAVAVDPEWSMAAWTVGLFVALELISNNLIEPWLYGSSTGVSSFAVIVAAVFWSWMWGPIGLLLSTPLTVCLAVMGRYVPSLRFLHVLLADEPALNDEMRLYHRLLARKSEEAADFAEGIMEKHSLGYVFGEVMTPALSLAEHDRHEGLLDERTEKSVFEMARGIVDDLAVTAECSMTGEGNGEAVTTLCIPANDEADEICARMLTCLLRKSGVAAEALSTQSLMNEYLERIRETGAKLVCISALPPSALRQARLFCRKVRAEFPEVKIVLGLWSKTATKEEMAARMADTQINHLVLKLDDAVQIIRQMVEAKTVEVREAEEVDEKSGLGSLIEQLKPSA